MERSNLITLVGGWWGNLWCDAILLKSKPSNFEKIIQICGRIWRSRSSEYFTQVKLRLLWPMITIQALHFFLILCASSNQMWHLTSYQNWNVLIKISMQFFFVIFVTKLQLFFFWKINSIDVQNTSLFWANFCTNVLEEITITYNDAAYLCIIWICYDAF